MKVTIHSESIGDQLFTREINESAFARRDEADLVDALREDGSVLLSLVAEADGHIAGHILFTRMWVGATPAVALAPMAVMPQHQRRGIGGQLIVTGLAMLRERGERIVVVLGHPEYYSRFGFSTEKARALESPFPAEAYMAIDLMPGALEGVHGRVRYSPAFGIE